MNHKNKILTAQHSTAQHSTAQHSTAQHSTAQHRLDDTLKSPTCQAFVESGVDS